MRRWVSPPRLRVSRLAWLRGVLLTAGDVEVARIDAELARCQWLIGDDQ